MSIVIAILILCAVVMFHELGHFLMAKACHINVEEFAFGMGPKLLSFERGGTVYAWRLFPIGGMCIMQGEDEDDTSEGSFQAAKVWQRILVVAGGPVFNFILGFVCALVIVFSAGADPCTIVKVQSDSPAAQSGLQAGDLIVEYEGSSIANSRDLQLETFFNGIPDEINLTVERNGEKISLSFATTEEGGGGFSYNAARQKQDFPTSIRYAFGEIKYWIRATVKSLAGLVTGRFGIQDMSGPVGIVSAVDTAYNQAAPSGAFSVVITMLNMLILLSVNLGIVNLLPLPALDGGRLIFLFIECIRRKRCDQKIEGMVHFVGIVALLGLAAVIAFNDVLKLI